MHPVDPASRLRRRPRLAPLAACLLATVSLGACSYLGADGVRVTAGWPARIADSAGGRLLTVGFYSPALGRSTDYLVYLPASYKPSRPVPAFYMLHGMPGRPLAFTVNGHVEARLERLIRDHRVPSMILVFPDGRIDGNTHTDSEWANTKSGRFDSYLIDVVRDVDRRFAALPFRRDRVIAGLSAGAYGAINVGLHHLDVFGSIQVWSGYFAQTPTGVFAHAGRSELAYNSPIEFVRTLATQLRVFPTRLFLFVGRHDSDMDQLAPMAAALRAEGAHVRSAVFSGGHSWKLWDAHLDQMLIMAGYDVRHAMRQRPA
jgi:enterochelin esterase-like enzyme